MLGIFNKDEMEDTVDYGFLIRKDEFLKKIVNMLERNRILFEPDYLYGSYVTEQDAERVIIELSKLK
jgi:hypothetical protein